MGKAKKIKSEKQNYTLWIEAEEWVPGHWVPDDDNTDVIVTFQDGRRWVASFFSYKNIEKLTNKNKETGECYSGAYFWSSDMILIDQVSRKRIEEIIEHLIEEEEFEMIFTHIPPEIEQDE